MKYLLYFFMSIYTLHAIEPTNKLQDSTPPYLQQHVANPIHWYPWGEEAFLKAKKEKKAVFLSIGYSTCHWCHVMARESFENKDLAKIFNKYFIAIKVDREEMPHLDSYYQGVYQMAKGRVGGWPLSVFMTPEKQIFFLATYIPPTKRSYHEGLDTLLEKLYNLHTNEYENLLTQVEDINAKIQKASSAAKKSTLDVSQLTLIKSIYEDYDDIYSGFGRRKKFPESSRLALMQDLALLEQNKELSSITLEMLDVMALRGLYDHIGGGFFRYTVDAAWEIPHFEKMLYNQAELIPLYTKAYQQTNKELYKNVVTETIAMLDTRFTQNSLYYSASDADTNHVEGDFFLFNKEEINKALKKNTHSKRLRESLEFSVNGNFDSKVHLNFYTNKRPEGFVAFKKELQKVRQTKEFPFIDKKINTAWNAMMIKALYTASSIDESYGAKADKHLKALKQMMFKNSELYHQSIIEKEVKQLALLEDYAFLISALLEKYHTSLDKKNLAFIEYLLVKAKENFYRDGIWYLSNDKLNIKADMKDKYYASPLSVMLENILKFAAIKASFKYEKLAKDTLSYIHDDLRSLQSNAPNSARAFLMQKEGVVTIKSTKENLLKYMKEIDSIKYPYITLKVENSDEFLACTMRSCFAIDKDFQKVKKIIEDSKWRNK